MDKEEKMVPSAEEKEKEEEEIKDEGEEKEEEEEEEKEEEAEEEKGKDDTGDDEKVEDGDCEEQERKDEKEEEEAAVVPQAEDETEKNIPAPAQPKEKKQDGVLNLNNEVVKMRKEVKRVKVLIVRKLIRRMDALKKKKGNEMEKEKDLRRAARMLEEIHAMKHLKPDVVTKTALSKTFSFEAVCDDPKATISDRAMARIATHPQFNKKIEDIKAAVEAFKAERMKDGKQGGKEKVQNKAAKMTPQPQNKRGKTKREKDVKQKEIIDNEEGDSILKDTKDATVAEPKTATPSADTADGQRKQMPESKNVRPAPIKSSEAKNIVKNKPQSKDAEKKPVNLKSASKVCQKKGDEEESDLESSGDEEKVYFDDSTEERFNRQSSQSEESDDDDNFFVEKVSKFKKKKKKKSVETEEADEGREAKSSDKVQSELDELESRLKSKGASFQSVFCSSLSFSKSAGGRGAGRGRGGDRFRGRGQNRDFSQESKFQRQERGGERYSGSNYSKPYLDGRERGRGRGDFKRQNDRRGGGGFTHQAPQRGSPFGGRGRGRGRGDFNRQNDRRGGGAFTHQAPQQVLHPSWEASKKRKEQQGQILPFQGKKIKFDDD